MRSRLRIILCVLALTSILAWTGTTGAHLARAQTVQVTIKNFSFQPDPITVHVGATVTWTNSDMAPHTASADDGSWTTNTLQPGNSGSVTFNQAGTFPYHCKIHPNMHGTLVVQAQASTPVATTTTPNPTATSPPLAAYPVVPSAPNRATTRKIATRIVHARYQFVPRVTRITVGARVIWTNQGHSLLGIRAKGHWSFRSHLLGYRQSVSYTFAKAGTYRYVRTNDLSMTGTIMVARS